MPGYNNIQTFDMLNGSDYQPTLNRFSSVLKNTGLWNDELARAISDFRWHVEEDGLVYSSITLDNYYLSKFSAEIKIRPHVLVYTHALDKTFQHNWICCDLLIDTESLGSFETGYYPFVASLVKSLAFEMFKEFQQPVYFTDEIQDGQDFDAIRTGDRSTAWQFDYALLPLPLNELYEAVPKTHNILLHEDYAEAWSVEMWKDKIVPF